MTPTPPESAMPDAEPASVPPAVSPTADKSPQLPAGGVRPVHVVAAAAAIAGGALVTLLVMDAQPAAEAPARPAARVTTATPPRAVKADPDPADALTAAIDPAAPVKWSSKTAARWVNPSRTSAAFELDAERPIAVWNDTVTPALVVRCTKGRVDAFVYTDSAARIEAEDENHTVQLSYDDGAGISERWPDSVEHDALFAPDGRALTDRLSSARTFRFTFTPHNAGPATTLFDVRGLKEKMAETKACRTTR